MVGEDWLEERSIAGGGADKMTKYELMSVRTPSQTLTLHWEAGAGSGLASECRTGRYYERKENRATEFTFKAVLGSFVGLWWTTKVRIRLFSIHVMMYVSSVDLQEGVLITARRSATRCVPFVIWINSYRTNTNYRCNFITDSVSDDTRQLATCELADYY